MRTEFPSKVRVEAFRRCGGLCEKCTAKLSVGKFHYDHIIPDAFGGEPILSNCQVLCVNCHGEKTAKVDVPAYAKSNRVRSKHLTRSDERPKAKIRSAGFHRPPSNVKQIHEEDTTP